MELSPKAPSDSNAIENCTKEELLARIKTLQAHNTQLKNIIAKSGAKSPKTSSPSKRPFDFSKCTFRHVLLKFFYLGWDYQGYAVQEDSANTIEHHLFEALTKTCLIQDRSLSNYHRCGRTDKGVSAFSQVISIDLRSQSSDLNEEINYCKVLNRALPPSIQCVAWSPVPDNFSSRFDCKGRTYKYFFPKSGLDIEKMRQAAEYLVGPHDFRNFCKMDVANGVVEFVRSISQVRIEKFDSSQDTPFAVYVVTIEGKAFLWHQIRCIMSILFLVGERKEEPSIIAELLDVEKNPRKPDYNMACEIPLNLYSCEYDNAEWIYEKEAVNIALTTLWDKWTLTQAKASMLQNMLMDLGVRDKDTFNRPSNKLVLGVKAKNYVPVMKRKLCGSLEEKIEQYKKRNKLN